MTWPDLIRDALTVGGTLGGTLLGIWLTNRHARHVAHHARAEARRDAVADALAELTDYLDRHRAVMWRMVHHRLASAAGLIPADLASHRDDLAASRASRAAITRPLTVLCLRAPELAQHARTAAHATYAMRRATRLVDLERRRAAALRAATDLIEVAGAALGPPIH